MKRSTLKKCEPRHPFFIFLISLVIALTVPPTATKGSVFAEDVAKAPEQQTTSQEQTDVRELKPDEPIERELAGTGAHFYRVTVNAGQYLQILVKEKGIDVVLKMSGTNGERLPEVNEEFGEGVESFPVLAEAITQYTIEVRATNKGATTGSYQIKIGELREATAHDRDYMAAAKIMFQAMESRKQDTADSLRKSIATYEKVLPLWRALGDRKNEAYTLGNIGFVYTRSGELEKALQYYGQSLQISQTYGYQIQQRVMLNNISTVYGRLAQREKALEYLFLALPLARAQGDRSGEAIALNNIGTEYLGLGRFQEALDYFDEALPRRRALGDRPGEATTLANIASAYTLSGESEKALSYYKQALSLRRELEDRRGLTVLLNNLGSIHLRLDQPRKALEYLQEALTLRRAVGDRLGEAASLADIGVAYSRLGEHQQAIDHSRRGLALAQELGNPVQEANILSLIGEIYSNSGEPQKAQEYLDRALQIGRSLNDWQFDVITLNRMARVEGRAGNLTRASMHIETALKIIESIDSRFTNAELRTSFLASKQNSYASNIDLLMQRHRQQPSAGHEAAGLQASERARARGLLQILREARADIRRGVDPILLESERTLQKQLNAKSERLSRLLSGKHNEQQATALRKEVDELVADYQDVQAQIRSKSPRYASLTQPEPISLQEIQRFLDRDTLLLEYSLGKERSYLWVVSRTALTSFELPKRDDIEAVAKKVYEALTARNKLIRFETQQNKQRRAKEADKDYLTDSRRLSQMVLGPAAGHLGNKRLLVVSDGALQYVPFGALPIPSGDPKIRSQAQKAPVYHPLITKHEIVNLPSASIVSLLRKDVAGRQRAAKTVAVFGDPVFQNDDSRVKTDLATNANRADEPSIKSATTRNLSDPIALSARDTGVLEFRRLPHSRHEAEGIAALTSKTMTMSALDFDADRATAMSSDLSNYRIVHFATHGLINSKHPELSGIVLSLVNKDGQPQNGFLRLHEIYNLKLGADLVVLSACRTALGKDVKGEGLVGLTRGFMYAGAPRVVASLWAVDDEITAQLMKEFYRAMLIDRQRPAAALRTAQLAISKRRRLPPYFWAAFVLQGEWQ
ncbi:MAG TPA: CHAT domain-containing protein [Pyrinomonadaceae bacterium]